MKHVVKSSWVGTNTMLRMSIDNMLDMLDFEQGISFF